MEPPCEAEIREHSQLLYYRHIANDPISVWRRLASCAVAVLGAGGLGGEVIRHLISGGVGALLIIDSDVVEQSNLNRQHWFYPSDVGRSKADVLADRISQFAPSVKVLTSRAHITSEAGLQGVLDNSKFAANAIICCADTPIGIIETTCLKVGVTNGCAVGITAMHVRRGYWSLITDSNASGSAKKLFEQARKVASQMHRTALGSASWTNAIIAALFADEVLMHLAGLPIRSANQMMAFDLDRMTFEVTANFYDAGVPTC